MAISYDPTMDQGLSAGLKKPFEFVYSYLFLTTDRLSSGD